jgi:ArsR family metal-binding transcriptional regulator
MVMMVTTMMVVVMIMKVVMMVIMVLKYSSHTHALLLVMSLNNITITMYGYGTVLMTRT